MLFRNLTIYRLAAGWSRTAAELETALEAFPPQPCTGMSMQTRGWVPVNSTGQLVYNIGTKMLICMGADTKVLPAAVVKRAADDRIAEVEREKGFKLGRKARLAIKELVAAELTPRAFCRRAELRGWIDFAGGWLVVDTASAGRADEFTQTLRDTLGELPVTPLQAAPSAGVLMTKWLADRQAPADFDLDDECTLVAHDEHKATVRYQRHSLDGLDVRRHLIDGKRVARLGLTYCDRLSMVLDEQLQVRKVKALDTVRAREDDGAEQTPEQQFEADFALMSGELSGLLTSLHCAVAQPF